MAFGQGQFRPTGHGTEQGDAGSAEGRGQHALMPRGGDAIEDDAGDANILAPARKASHKRRDGLALAFGIDHQHHGQPQRGSEIPGGPGAIGGTIEEAHDPFYEQELGAHGLLSRQSLNLAGAHRPGVEIDGFAPRCATQKAWVDIVRAGLGRGDDMTRAPQGGQQPQRHQGFSRARARRGDDQPPSQRRVSSPR